MTDRWAEWKEGRSRCPLLWVSRCHERQGQLRKASRYARELKGTNRATQSPFHGLQEGQEEPFPHLLSNGARDPGVVLGPSQIPYIQRKAYRVHLLSVNCSKKSSGRVATKGPPACHHVFLTDPCLRSLCPLCLSPLSRCTLGS